jgi:hypothetical protein
MSIAVLCVAASGCMGEMATIPGDDSGSSTFRATSDGGSLADAGTRVADSASPDSGTGGAPDTGVGPGLLEDASAPGDSGTASASLGCADGAGLAVCSDFESGEVDTTLWSVFTKNGGRVTVDSTNAIEGDYSLHLELPSADRSGHGGLRLRSRAFLPVEGNAFYGRAMIYVDALPDHHSVLIAAEGPLGGETAQYGLHGSHLNSRYFTPTVDAIQHGGYRKRGYEITPGEWLCIEWHYDGAHDEMRYWFNGEAEPSMTVTSSEDPPWVAPVFDSLDIGYKVLGPTSAASVYNIYYDAIALDTSRIGCGGFTGASAP